MISRRIFLEALAAVQVLVPSRADALAAAASSGPRLGPPARFDFAILKAMAAERAAATYAPPPMPDPAIVRTMSFEAERHIAPDPKFALFGDGRGAFPVSLLPVGRLFPTSTRIDVIAGDDAREVLYEPDYFLSPPGGPLSRLPDSPSPIAGLEFHEARDAPARRAREGWARFLGASYFRAVGEADQFGVSARGVALGSGTSIPEEFPDFVRFWVGEARSDDDPVMLYALLDGPSIVGAYRFAMRRGRAVTMDVTLELHLRKPIERLGIAPMTSMFWYSETVKGAATDWRPEVHDSDGAAIWLASGEHLWRPLTDPGTVTISSFPADRVLGFGLMQRDRSYDHYLDAVAYEKRPCCWCEPSSEWSGSVELLEIPTNNEIYDNIVLSFVPAAPAKAGDVLSYGYRLLWRDSDPFPGDLALCVATRLGAGGVQGAPRSGVLRKFVLEFRGTFTALHAAGAVPQAVLSTSRGTFSHLVVEPSPDGDVGLWRVQFDLDPEGSAPLELRCHLAYAGKPLSETWVYPYAPFSSPVR